ncbi:hypothetical protein QTI33_08555 [Variovorax sp. J22P271]|uniref:hypothetical protein n=1 Tax=Variovorax davisae TaxID=3053515 RepID=UPI00257624E7|nr:hypothetical protein [Variovorax sp. J22P271]MDM0032184.1 hypothetical protein [Variovorax sp. J22P271]
MSAPSEPPAADVAFFAAHAEDGEIRFSYKGWQVQLQLDGHTPEGCVTGHAEVRAGSFACRLVMASHHHDDVGALEALAQKARELIEDRETLAAESLRISI